MYRRPAFEVILKRLQEPRRFIQVLAGPRQTGKTTLARQTLAAFKGASHYASGDEPALKSTTWIEQQWETARARLRDGGQKRVGLLVLDEIHKVPQWSESVKRLWDEDSANGLPLHVIILGSSPLLVQHGLSESLAGRFEIIRVTHWSYGEMQRAFRCSLDDYLFFGGYPGSALLISDLNRWRSYILDSLIETSISRDVLLMTRVDKPVLLRRLFELGCTYSGQVLAFHKMLGQLQDAGNTTTLAHYLHLLAGAGLIAGIDKYAGQRVRQRASSPKLCVYNTALMSASGRAEPGDMRKDTAFRGRLVESAVGAHLLNTIQGTGIELFYWLSRNREVDFVLRRKNRLTAIEVKSGRRKDSLPGLEAFANEFKVTRKLLVGGDGIPLDEFLATPAEAWLE